MLPLRPCKTFPPFFLAFFLAEGGMDRRTSSERSMYIDSDTKIQVIDTMSELPRAEKEQCGAFIVGILFFFFFHPCTSQLTHDRQRDERAIVVWADSFENIMPLCRDLEEKMIKLVWRHRHSVARSETPTGSADVSAVSSVATSNVNLTERAVVEKERANTSATSKPNAAWRWHWRSTLKTDAPRSSDPEKEGAEEKEPRPVRLYAPFYCGLAVALSICRAFARRSSSLAHFFFSFFQSLLGVALPSCSPSGL